MKEAIGYLLVWLSGVATVAALLIGREWLLGWRGARTSLPPATHRQIRAARASRRLHLPHLYLHDARPDEDTTP